MSTEDEKLAIVLRLKKMGLSQEEIEKQLAAYDLKKEENITDHTVRVHADQIADKLIGPGSGVILGPDGKPLKK